MYKLTKSLTRILPLVAVAMMFVGCRYTQEVCWNNSGWFAVVMSERLGTEVQFTQHYKGTTVPMTLRQDPGGEFRLEALNSTGVVDFTDSALLKGCDIDGVPYVEAKNMLLGETSYTLYKVSETLDPASQKVVYDFTLVSFDQAKLQAAQIPFEAKRTDGRPDGILMDLIIRNDGVSSDVLMTTRATHQGSPTYSLK